FPLQQIKGGHQTSFTVTPMATIDGGYALIYANSTNITGNNSFFIRGSVYANFITYNNTLQDRTILLYTFTNNVTFNGIYCDIVSVGVGQVCTLSVNNTMTNNVTTQYIKIYFLTSGSVLRVNVISDLPNVTSIASINWVVNSMSFGGYILHNFDLNGTTYIYAYDEFNFQAPLVSTLSSNQTVPINNFSTTRYTFGANLITNNNTFLLPTLNTNVDQTSWSFINIPLPKILEYQDHGFGNLLINQVNPPINSTIDSSITTSLNIVFFDPVVLTSDQIHGHLTIYKTSDNSIRQKVSPLDTDFCSTDPDGKTITIRLISSTFNEYNESYYVQMDNNFVKNSIYKEPLKGIGNGIWNLSSDNMNNLLNSSGSTIIGTVGLTYDAIPKFTSFSRSDRSNYFRNLLNDIADKLPIRRERLATDKKFQYNNYGQIIFSIEINLPSPDLNENTVDSVAADLSTMLLNNKVTAFRTGITGDLDGTYGFVILIAINFFFTTYFVFIHTKEKPYLYLPRPTKEQEEKMIEKIAGDAKEKIINETEEYVNNFFDGAVKEILNKKNKEIEEIDEAAEKFVDTKKIDYKHYKMIEKIRDEIKKKLIDKTDKIIKEVSDKIKDEIINNAKKFDGIVEKQIIDKTDLMIEEFSHIHLNEETLEKFGDDAKKIIDKFDPKDIIKKIKDERNKILKEANQGKVKKIINKIVRRIKDVIGEIFSYFKNDDY
ncbi:1045_t:CDS:2, partial [Dentiscutata heterogama]